MAAGLPVITTPNCGGPDIITNGYNGMIMEVGATQELIRNILWAKEHPNEMEAMSFHAQETAKKFTWERYESGIVSAVRQIVTSAF